MSERWSWGHSLSGATAPCFATHQMLDRSNLKQEELETCEAVDWTSARWRWFQVTRRSR